MIINVRGTHGSGKTTLVKRVRDSYTTVTPWMVDGRKRPFGYHLRSDTLSPLTILGSYENATGGCDTISEIEVMFDAIKTLADGGQNVLFEGIVAQHSSGRLMDLHKIHPVDVIVLQTTLEVAIESVKVRRAERGADVENFDPKNVIKEYKSVLSSTKTLIGRGAVIHKLDREEGFQWVMSRLNTTPGEVHASI
jgi:hypothetical protein